MMMLGKRSMRQAPKSRCGRRCEEQREKRRNKQSRQIQTRRDYLDPSAVQFNPKLVKRLSAAALMDHQESLWGRPEITGYRPRRG